jgi:hypothetical protein
MATAPRCPPGDEGCRIRFTLLLPFMAATKNYLPPVVLIVSGGCAVSLTA